jgi:LPXTG-motif cell wall-anchored protein
MNNTIVQAGLWLAAGVLLILFLARRRKRRVSR